MADKLFLQSAKLRLLIVAGHDYLSFISIDQSQALFADGKAAMLDLWAKIEALRTNDIAASVNYLGIFDCTDKSSNPSIMTCTARVRKIATGEIFDVVSKNYTWVVPFTDAVTLAKANIGAILDPLLYVYNIAKIEIEVNPNYIA